MKKLHLASDTLLAESNLRLSSRSLTNDSRTSRRIEAELNDHAGSCSNFDCARRASHEPHGQMSRALRPPGYLIKGEQRKGDLHAIDVQGPVCSAGQCAFTVLPRLISYTSRDFVLHLLVAGLLTSRRKL